MYDPNLVNPMREELTQAGVQELKTIAEVDAVLADGKQPDSLLVVVNSVCGCAAGGARPGVIMALQGEKKPLLATTVFAGQDKEATEQARSYFLGQPPSSPSIALFKAGQLVHFVHRHEIEGYSPEQIAANLSAAFEQHC